MLAANQAANPSSNSDVSPVVVEFQETRESWAFFDVFRIQVFINIHFVILREAV